MVLVMTRFFIYRNIDATVQSSPMRKKIASATEERR